MSLLRWLAAGLLGTLASLVGLVGVLLCVTVILLPLGIPILMIARRLFSAASALVVPRAVRHPVDELDRAGTEAARKLRRTGKEAAVSGAGSMAEGAKATYERTKGSVSDIKPEKRARKLRRSIGKRTGRRNRLDPRR